VRSLITPNAASLDYYNKRTAYDTIGISETAMMPQLAIYFNSCTPGISAVIRGYRATLSLSLSLFLSLSLPLYHSLSRSLCFSLFLNERRHVTRLAR